MRRGPLKAALVRRGYTRNCCRRVTVTSLTPWRWRPPRPLHRHRHGHLVAALQLRCYHKDPSSRALILYNKPSLTGPSMGLQVPKLVVNWLTKISLPLFAHLLQIFQARVSVDRKITYRKSNITGTFPVLQRRKLTDLKKREAASVRLPVSILFRPCKLYINSQAVLMKPASLLP